jgi:hypothetical protein
MPGLKELISAIKLLIHGGSRGHPEGQLTEILEPAVPIGPVGNDFNSEGCTQALVEGCAEASHAVSSPLVSRRQLGTSLQWRAGTTFTPLGLPEQESEVYRYEFDGTAWGTPIETMCLSDETHRMLRWLGVETIEELSQRIQALLNHNRFREDLRFELQSRLAEWKSHTREQIEYVFGADDCLEDEKYQAFLMISGDAHECVSEITEIPSAMSSLGDRYPSEYPFETNRTQVALSPCYTCDTPTEVLRSLIEIQEPVSIEVVLGRISEICESECLYCVDTIRCTGKHVKAHVRQLNDRCAMIRDGILCFRKEEKQSSNKNRAKNCGPVPVMQRYLSHPTGIEEASYLEPSREAAIRPNVDTTEVDHDARLALRSDPVVSAVSLVLQRNASPMGIDEIKESLGGKYSHNEIWLALSDGSHFVQVEPGRYDFANLLGGMDAQDFPKELPEIVISFIKYLSTHNNSSYKLVLASIFINTMDDNGCVSIATLTDEMYRYYSDRNRKGLLIEAEGLVVNQIERFNEQNIKNRIIKNPILSFLGSQYFISNDDSLYMSESLYCHLSKPDLHRYITNLINYQIEGYFISIGASPLLSDNIKNSLAGLENQRQEIPNAYLKTTTNEDKLADYQLISIKKKRRSKIPL